MNIAECRDYWDWAELLRESHEMPVLLFKHSTTCPTSAGAWARFSRFAEEDRKARFWRILVRENRALSQMVADQTGVKHQSPQVLLFRGGVVVGSKSQRAITESSLEQLLASVQS